MSSIDDKCLSAKINHCRNIWYKIYHRPKSAFKHQKEKKGKGNGNGKDTKK